MTKKEIYASDVGSKKISIEKAVQNDLPDILELLKLANMHYIPSPEMPSLTFENYFVARLAGKIVGFCGYKILSDTHAKTELMVVHPDCRGLGIGYILQKHRMERMCAGGIKTLTTNTDLPESIKWYCKHFGYRKIGTLNKLHEFGDKTIDHWTTLEVDLVQWNSRQQENFINE